MKNQRLPTIACIVWARLAVEETTNSLSPPIKELPTFWAQIIPKFANPIDDSVSPNSVGKRCPDFGALEDSPTGAVLDRKKGLHTLIFPVGLISKCSVINWGHYLAYFGQVSIFWSLFVFFFFCVSYFFKFLWIIGPCQWEESKN